MNTNLTGTSAIDLARANELASAARGVSSPFAKAGEGRDATPEEAGARFEAMLGTMLAKELRRGMDEGFFGSGPGADTFQSWLDDFVGRAMAERGALGTADLVRDFAVQRENDEPGLPEPGAPALQETGGLQ